MATGTRHQIGSKRVEKELVIALRQYRLEHDFTYRQLARLMRISHVRLFTLLNDRHPMLTERTLFRVEQFAQQVGLVERVAS